MKKLIQFFLFIFFVGSTSSQTIPNSFAWRVGNVKDQLEQGPCNLFASTALVESWVKNLYPSLATVNLSETQLYSPCASANPAPSTAIRHALGFLKTFGVVERTCIPYQSGNACTTPAVANSNAAYYGIRFGNSTTTPAIPNTQVTYSLLVNNDCGTPYCNCTVGAANYPVLRYKIADSASFSIASLANADALKKAIMNHGPIAISMQVFSSSYPELHPGTKHAYLIYGWNGSSWLLVDSWPGNAKLNSTTLDLVDFCKNNPDHNAYVIKNVGSTPTVFRENFSNSNLSWTVDNTISPSCLDTTLSNAFSISAPATITTSGAVVSVTNLNLIDNASVEWSFQSTAYNAVVSFSPNPSTNNSSVIATGVVSGNGYIIAKIKRPNGLCETVRRYNVTVKGNNIPFTYTKTADQCIGSTRRISYQVSSPYPINCSWSFNPIPGSQYSTSISGCTFTVNYTSYPSSYGLLVFVTSPSAFPGITSSATAGGPVNPCGGFTRASRNPLFEESNKLIVQPNPARSKLTIRLPGSLQYTVSVLSSAGALVSSQQAIGNLELNLSHQPKGIYLLRISANNNRRETIVQKIILE